MRVTFLVSNYAPSVGGVQEYVRRVAEGLARDHGVSVDVVTSDALLAPAGPDPGRVGVHDEVMSGVAVHRRPVARRTHGGLRTVRRLGRRLRVYSPGRNTLLISGPLGLRAAVTACSLARRSDVIVGVGAPTAALFGAWGISRVTPLPFVAMPLLHLDDVDQRPWVVRALRAASATSVNSQVEARWVAAQGVDSRRIAVQSPGCDPARYPDLTPREARSALDISEQQTVGFVGRLAVHKGLDALIEAMRGVWLSRPDTQLLLAGPPAGWNPRERLAHLSDAERSRVRLWGRFTDEERPLLFAACEVIAHPSRSESFGMVTIEAWCSRRPVVVGDIAVTRELVRDGVDGDLVQVDDAAALGARLARLLQDPHRCARYGSAGRARAEQEFDWSRLVESWATLLRQVASGASV